MVNNIAYDKNDSIELLQNICVVAWIQLTPFQCRIISIYVFLALNLIMKVCVQGRQNIYVVC